MSMLLERLTRHTLQSAERRKRVLALAITERLADQVSGIAVTAQGDRIIVSGRSLHRRWLEDGRLRFLAELVR